MGAYQSFGDECFLESDCLKVLLSFHFQFYAQVFVVCASVEERKEGDDERRGSNGKRGG